MELHTTIPIFKKYLERNLISDMPGESLRNAARNELEGVQTFTSLLKWWDEYSSCGDNGGSEFIIKYLREHGAITLSDSEFERWRYGTGNLADPNSAADDVNYIKLEKDFLRHLDKLVDMEKYGLDDEIADVLDI